MNEKKVKDNKKLWKIVKPFVSNKCFSNNKVVNLVEEDEIISTDTEIAEVLNTFFSNIVGNLNILEYPTSDPISDNICDPVLKADKIQKSSQ